MDNDSRETEQTTVLPAARGDEQIPALGSGAYYAGVDGEGDRINPWDYINVILRRRWTVGLALTLCVLFTLVLKLSETPMYKATALLQIHPVSKKVTDFDSVQSQSAQSLAYNDFYQTQYQLLSSRTLARHTIDRLDLGEQPAFNGELQSQAIRSRLRSWVMGLVPSFGGDDAPAGEIDQTRLAMAREQRNVGFLLQHLEIVPRRRSFLVEVGFSSPDPALAQSVAEATARGFVDLTLNQSIEAASQTKEFINRQLAKVKAKLEQSEEDMHAFAQARGINASEKEGSVIHERLADLNRRLTQAQSERIGFEVVYRKALEQTLDQTVTLDTDELTRALRKEIATAEAERASLAASFTDEYRAVRELDARIAQLRLHLDDELSRRLGWVKSEYEIAQDEEDLLRKQLESQRLLVVDYEQRAIDLKIVRRDVQTNRQIYENLLRRMKEVEVTGAMRSTNISLVDAPEVPLAPYAPQIQFSLAIACLIGLSGGVGLAFLQELLDDTIKSPDDVERFLRLPTLGTIPEFSIEKEGDPESPGADRTVVAQPTSAGAEAIRTLRASLFLAAPGGLPTRLLLTSARPAEGKTCITYNLAAALGQMGSKVCVVDCDLRRPRLHKVVGVSLTPGLTNHLTGNLSIDEIIRRDEFGGVDFITAGPTPPNPVDLLNSKVLLSAVNELEERYDYVLFDAPPALGFADVPILCNQLGGGCLLVTKAGATSRRVVKHACDYLIRMQSKLLGVVINRVSTRSTGYSYYGYGYGGYGGYSGYYHYGDYYRSDPEDSLVESDKADSA